jgi:hypothetical protein
MPISGSDTQRRPKSPCHVGSSNLCGYSDCYSGRCPSGTRRPHRKTRRRVCGIFTRSVTEHDTGTRRKCLRGDLIKNRTVIMVTHNVALTSKIADFVVSLGLDGRVHSQGSISDALATDDKLAEEVIKEQAILEKAEAEIESILLPADEPKKPDGKLILAEEIDIGRVSWSAMNMFFTAMGGDHAILFFTGLVSFSLMTALAGRLETWYLGYWARYDLLLRSPAHDHNLAVNTAMVRRYQFSSEPSILFLNRKLSVYRYLGGYCELFRSSILV